MPTAPLPRPVLVAGLGFTLIAGILAGCSTPDDGDFPSPETLAGLPPVAMDANGDFFAGSLGVKLSLARGRPGGPRGGKRGEHRPHDYVPALQPHGIGTTPPGMTDDRDEIGPGRMRSPMGPTLTLHLSVANQGQAPVDVTIEGADSELGNFAVRPEVLHLAPGQSQEVDPMFSQLGIVADRIPVKVTLILGGKRETKTLNLQTLAPAGSAQP